MLEKPYRVIAGFAAKFQAVADNVKQKAANVSRRAANVSQSFTRRAEVIEARKHARREARIAEMALKAFGNRPSTTFLREIRHGQMTFRFFECTSRTGEVRRLCTLNRDTVQGRTRLATVSMEEYRSIREMSRAVRQQVANQNGRSARQEPYQKTSYRNHENGEQVRGQAQPQGQRESRTARNVASEGRVQGTKPQEWALVHVESLNFSGSATARVVESSQDLKALQEVRRQSPKLAFLNVSSSRPLRYGDVITVHRSDGPEIARRMSDLRQQARIKVVQSREKANGVDHSQQATRQAKQLTNQNGHSQGM